MPSSNITKTAVSVTAGMALLGISNFGSSISIGSEKAADYDILIKNGVIYDGTGNAPFRGDVAVRGDRIAYVGPAIGATGTQEIDAKGKAVAPGFINMLSWSTDSLIHDGRAVSDINQGVTLEVMGEGWSMGPVNDKLKQWAESQQSGITYEIDWKTLDGYLRKLEDQGISPNVASFVGATTVRLMVLGDRDIDPSETELDEMRSLVATAMRGGAMGLGSSLIYPPASFSETPELVALATEAGKCNGMYISHLRSEADQIEGAVDELIDIAEQSGAAGEIYHLKFGGSKNWSKFDSIVRKIEAARERGIKISANMYNYDGGATGLSASMPPWVQEGGFELAKRRLRDPTIRGRIIEEMRSTDSSWENLLHQSDGTGNRVLIIGLRNESLKPLIGKTLAEIADLRRSSVEETVLDLILEDDSRVEAVYRMMSEENTRRQIKLPWVSFGSDAPGQATEGLFLETSMHPRAYGNFARLLGRYVRDESLITLEEAVHRLSGFPASNLKLRKRGFLRNGYFADVVIFNPNTVKDHATYAAPHQYSTGVDWVWVNGVSVLADGSPTGEKPGRVVRGPGWSGWPEGGACPGL